MRAILPQVGFFFILYFYNKTCLPLRTYPNAWILTLWLYQTLWQASDGKVLEEARLPGFPTPALSTYHDHICPLPLDFFACSSRWENPWPNKLRGPGRSCWWRRHRFWLLGPRRLGLASRGIPTAGAVPRALAHSGSGGRVRTGYVVGSSGRAAVCVRNLAVARSSGHHRAFPFSEKGI